MGASMTICAHLVDCGPLGEVELTVSYKYRPARSGHGVCPDSPESAGIGWIKIGGHQGVEVEVSDDYISDEIIPACVADWHGEEEVAAEAKGEAMRERQRREAA